MDRGRSSRVRSREVQEVVGGTRSPGAQRQSSRRRLAASRSCGRLRPAEIARWPDLLEQLDLLALSIETLRWPDADVTVRRDVAVDQRPLLDSSRGTPVRIRASDARVASEADARQPVARRGPELVTEARRPVLASSRPNEAATAVDHAVRRAAISFWHRRSRSSTPRRVARRRPRSRAAHSSIVDAARRRTVRRRRWASCLRRDLERRAGLPDSGHQRRASSISSLVDMERQPTVEPADDAVLEGAAFGR